MKTLKYNINKKNSKTIKNSKNKNNNNKHIKNISNRSKHRTHKHKKNKKNIKNSKHSIKTLLIGGADVEISYSSGLFSSITSNSSIPTTTSTFTKIKKEQLTKSPNIKISNSGTYKFKLSISYYNGSNTSNSTQFYTITKNKRFLRTSETTENKFEQKAFDLFIKQVYPYYKKSVITINISKINDNTETAHSIIYFYLELL